MRDLAPLFLHPRNPNHRQYEALRALAVDGLSLQQAAQQFGYAPQSLRNLRRDFRNRPHRDFFLPSIPGRKFAVGKPVTQLPPRSSERAR